MQTPDIQRNPHPKMRYEITIVIKDAPGPFDSAEGYISYEIINEKCAPFEKLAGIYRTPPSQHPSFPLTRIGDNEYKGIFYIDLLHDEDYYGLGVCHWKLSSVGVRLNVGGMFFTSYMDVGQIISGKPWAQYFYRSDYSVDARVGDAPLPGILGTPSTDYLEKYPEKRFEISMSAREDFE